MFVRSALKVNLAGFGLLALAMTGLAQVPAAQSSKVGVINLQRAVLESEEIKKASAAMEAKYKPRQAEIEKVQKELEGISQKLQTEAAKLTPQAQADLNALGQKKQREVQRLSEDLQGEVDRERQEILSRSTQKMQEVIRKLAEARGLDVVVDVSNTIYFKPALDFTNDALAEYNKAYPAK
ncbi:MAG: OmpH family outer membrane protein [Bryobacteraceae bacterium]